MKRNAQRTWLIAAAVLGVVSTMTTTAALAEDAVVKQPAATVLSGKTARSSTVAKLSAGDKVQVLGHEGSWLRVKIGDKEGYLHENALAGEKGGLFQDIGKGAGAMSSATAGRGASTASPLSSAEAGRGVGDSAKSWAGSKSMNTAGLVRMVAMRNSLTDPDWQQFAADGKGAK